MAASVVLEARLNWPVCDIARISRQPLEISGIAKQVPPRGTRQRSPSETSAVERQFPGAGKASNSLPGDVFIPPMNEPERIVAQCALHVVAAFWFDFNCSQDAMRADDQPQWVTAAGATFATTHWSTVLHVGGVDSSAARVALERLCLAYWYPLYAHVRRRGHGPDDAADLTQEFFAVLLRRNSLAQVGPEKGRFRTFLLTSLDYFLHDQAAHDRAAKRGGGAVLIELDALSAEQRFTLEPATEETPDKAFDRRWAAALLEQAFARLAVEQTQDGKAEFFAQLKPFLAREVEPGEYDVLARETGMASNTIAKSVQRLRLRARELLFDEAAQTVAAAADAERELRELFS